MEASGCLTITTLVPLEAEGPIMGVDLSHTMYLSFMQAFRARRYGRGVGVGVGSTFVLLFPIDS